jgi:hypothetical protein
MQVTLMRLLSALLSLALLSGAPREIPYGSDDDKEALVIPSDSPVHFRGFDKHHVARFDGRFVMSGTFVFTCDIECEPPLKKWQIYGEMIPDPDIAARLPHWKVRNGEMRIYITRGDRLANQIFGREKLARIASGKIDEVRRPVVIVVDDYRAAIECDGASYSARFIALAPKQTGHARLDAHEGC